MRLLLVFILLLTFGCNKRSETNSALDFNLVYQDDVDRIDFGANILTRKYVGSVRTIKIDIGKENRRRILDFILDNEVLRIEESRLRNNCDVQMLPQSSFKLEIVIDKGLAKTFNWTSNNCGDEIDILTRLVSLIREQTEAQIPAGKLQPISSLNSNVRQQKLNAIAGFS